MHKSELESILRRADSEPVGRETLGKFDLLFADGFSHYPHLSYQRFPDFNPDQFPGGMYVTTWVLAKGDHLFLGRPLYIEPTEHSLEARINAAREDAEGFYKRLKRLH